MLHASILRAYAQSREDLDVTSYRDRPRRSMRARLSSFRWPTAARLLVGAAGLALLIVGTGKFARAAGDAGAITLVVTGAILLLSPFVLDRLQRVSLSATNVDLWLTTQVSDRGAPEAAVILQRTELGSFVESYALVHDELTDPEYRAARIHLQDLLVHRAASVARHEKFEAGEVRRLFSNGSVVMRVLVLGLMQGDISLIDAGTVVSAVADSRSRNEQYQGIRLAEMCWPRFSATDKKEIRQAIQRANIDQRSDRWHVAQRVLGLP
jgi:hypothetical protein